MIRTGATDKEGVPEQLSLEESDLTWNTHRKIREFFSFPNDPEFHGQWLNWFYEALSAGQRKALRNEKLSDLNKDDFPRRPNTYKENN